MQHSEYSRSDLHHARSARYISGRWPSNRLSHGYFVSQDKTDMSLAQLPNELQQMVFTQHFGPCFLRRHVVAHLQQMHLMTVSHNDWDNGVYCSSHAHDRAIRRRVGLDYQKNLYYATRRKELALIHRNGELHRLIAERDWLQQPAMDYTTFEHFCSNAQDSQHQGREYLVLELFPKADFFVPPAVMPGLDARAREVLAHRTSPLLAIPAYDLYVTALDVQIYRGLANLWLAALRRLPASVKKVMVIVKNNKPGLVGFDCLNNEDIPRILQELQRMNNKGRIVYRGRLSRFDRIIE